MIANYPFQRMKLDLLDLSNMNPKLNKGYKWLFNLVDVYTRYAICIPLKNKGDSECFQAFKKSLEGIRLKYFETPIQIDSDNESSFKSKRFKDYCIKNSIKQNFSDQMISNPKELSSVLTGQFVP